MTANELAEELEVSERTIYRDLDALSAAGIPVYAERGPGGGCQLLGGYQTKLTGLTKSEVRALFLLSVADPLTDLGLGQALKDAMLKLSAALPATYHSDLERVHQRMYLDTTWWYQSQDPVPYLPMIQEAVWQDRTLCLLYSPDNGECHEQLVDPYGLVTKASVWYLVASVMGEIQVFRVSRIQAVEMTDESFTRPGGFDLATYWAEYCTQFEANYPHYPVTSRVVPDHTPLLSPPFAGWTKASLEQVEPPDVGEWVALAPQQRKKSILLDGSTKQVSKKKKNRLLLSGANYAMSDGRKKTVFRQPKKSKNETIQKKAVSPSLYFSAKKKSNFCSHTGQLLRIA